MTDNIVEFLTARLDEDWANVHGSGALQDDDLDCKCGSQESPMRVDCPARWAADIAAKRHVLADYQTAEVNAHFPNFDGGVAEGLKTAVCHLVSVYVDHPDYQQEWRP